jgi:long-chain acyl-CoA synthetase
LAAPRELKYQLIDAETQVMITLGLPMLYPQIAALKGAAKFQTLVVCEIEDFLPEPIARALGPAADRVGGAGREIEFASLIDNDGAFKRHPHKSLEDDVAVLQYTGGTTGEPKGAMLTHANFCAVLNISNHWDHQNVSRGKEKALAVLPLFHILGLTFIMLRAVANGEQAVLHIKGGAPLAMEVLQRFEALTGHAPKEGYGLTETAPLGTLQVLDKPARQGSVGLPAPHTTLEVVDLETGESVLPIGEKGEICFRGPQVMKGYWKRPEATAEAFRGGRFYTGDIGFLDQDGFVTLVDRKKDLILSGGFNVFPRNIEEAITRQI